MMQDLLGLCSQDSPSLPQENNMEELINKFKEYITKKKRLYIKQIMEDLDLQEYEVYGLIELLNKQGYSLHITEGKVAKVKIKEDTDIYYVPNELEHIKLLLISDTHLASKYDRLDILRYLYQKAEDTNVNYILHSGDLTDGLSGRPQQIYELKEVSYTGQRDYVIDKYPRSNILTYIVSGN